MRWGVQDQASDDHSTSELCMREIENCQEKSAGPTFVVCVISFLANEFAPTSQLDYSSLLT